MHSSECKLTTQLSPAQQGHSCACCWDLAPSKGTDCRSGVRVGTYRLRRGLAALEFVIVSLLQKKGLGRVGAFLGSVAGRLTRGAWRAQLAPRPCPQPQLQLLHATRCIGASSSASSRLGTLPAGSIAGSIIRSNATSRRASAAIRPEAHLSTAHTKGLRLLLYAHHNRGGLCEARSHAHLGRERYVHGGKRPFPRGVSPPPPSAPSPLAGCRLPPSLTSSPHLR